MIAMVREVLSFLSMNYSVQESENEDKSEFAGLD